jgi:uncharacterized protein YukE
MEASWHRFSAVYQGDAADQFRAHWQRTVDRFHEYIQRTESISTVLEERIEHLRQVNRTDSTLS